ncbi:hypothetical protein BKA70DRAFT_1283419, partial [Coprinopsis sp. MPI-PUGE-AT-0042]
FPPEIFELIFDKIGTPFITPYDRDFQHTIPRSALHNLSLCSQHLRRRCRSYLWHTLVLASRDAAEIGVGEYGKRLSLLCSTLSQEDGPASCVRNVWLSFYLDYTDDNMNDGQWLGFVPNILKTLRQLKLLHLSGNPRGSSLTVSNVTLATLECIRDNLLERIIIEDRYLPRSFLPVLPATLKRLRLTQVLCSHNEVSQPLQVSSRVRQNSRVSLAAPEVLHLEADAQCYDIMASQPVMFWQKLTKLSMVIEKESPTASRASQNRVEHMMRTVHQRLITAPPQLRHLSIAYRSVKPQVFDECPLGDLLPPSIKDAPPLPELTTLSLELQDLNLGSCPPSFRPLLNTYLDHPLSRVIERFELVIICGGPGDLYPAEIDPVHIWKPLDDRLANEKQLPNLKTVCLAICEGFRDLKGLRQQKEALMLEFKEAFIGTRNRGVASTPGFNISSKDTVELGLW